MMSGFSRQGSSQSSFLLRALQDSARPEIEASGDPQNGAAG